MNDGDYLGRPILRQLLCPLSWKNPSEIPQKKARKKRKKRKKRERKKREEGYIILLFLFFPSLLYKSVKISPQTIMQKLTPSPEPPLLLPEDFFCCLFLFFFFFFEYFGRFSLVFVCDPSFSLWFPVPSFFPHFWNFFFFFFFSLHFSLFLSLWLFSHRKWPWRDGWGVATGWRGRRRRSRRRRRRPFFA